jgi:hypothetical protein
VAIRRIDAGILNVIDATTEQPAQSIAAGKVNGEEGAHARAVLQESHDDDPIRLRNGLAPRLARRVELRLVGMRTSDDNASPSRREHTPLPDCLTRLLSPQAMDADHVAHSACPVLAGSDRRTYMRALATILLDLDRLARLTDLVVDPVKPG